jgi:hypothetical protein
VEENAVARNAARALGKLAPAAQAAIPDLLDTLEDEDPGLREAAARALGIDVVFCGTRSAGATASSRWDG